jgi:predicted CXXCH cytochrome family protein
VPQRTGDPAQAVRALFSPGGACFDCHIVRGPSRPGGLDYSVVPVTLPQRYLAHGWFDHAAHSTTACTACHDADRSMDAREVMIPAIATCRGCHGGESAHPPLVRSSCAMCHDYHRGPSAPRSVREQRPARTPRPPRVLEE